MYLIVVTASLTCWKTLPSLFSHKHDNRSWCSYNSLWQVKIFKPSYRLVFKVFIISRVFLRYSMKLLFVANFEVLIRFFFLAKIAYKFECLIEWVKLIYDSWIPMKLVSSSMKLCKLLQISWIGNRSSSLVQTSSF